MYYSCFCNFFLRLLKSQNIKDIITFCPACVSKFFIKFFNIWIEFHHLLSKFFQWRSDMSTLYPAYVCSLTIFFAYIIHSTNSQTFNRPRPFLLCEPHLINYCHHGGRCYAEFIGHNRIISPWCRWAVNFDPSFMIGALEFGRFWPGWRNIARVYTQRLVYSAGLT